MNKRRINKGFANSFQGSFGAEGKSGDIPYALLKAARSSGQLNLSNRSLTEIPEKVWKINIDVPEEAKNVALGNNDERWWDQVDLVKLILASNKLSNIPEDIKHLPALTVLDAHDNQIETLSEEIGELRELTRFNLSHNKLSVFPKKFVDIATLKVLLLNGNLIEKLPEDFGYLCNIDDLDLSDNQIKELPESFGNLKSLKKLNLSKNQITILPVGLESLISLNDLNLCSNNLHSLIPGFGKLTSLEILQCQYNKIQKFSTFTEAANIKQLSLGYNRIKEIEGEVFDKLPFLVTLDLRDNAISSIPGSLCSLKLLERIDLSNNSISGLPYVLGNMNLKSLTLDGNPLRGIRRDIISKGTQGILAYLKSRIPEPKQDISALESNKENKQPENSSPEEIAETEKNPKIKEASKEVIDQYLIATTKVIAHSTGASQIPENVWLPGAKVSNINISKNVLTEMPKQIENYATTLSELDVSRNKLTYIPPFVGNLSKLTYLDISNNQISSLPDEILSLGHLMQITASVNRFSSIPKVIFSLPKLETLLISGNQISEIDVDGLLKLKKLQILDLSNNSISRIPPQLGNVSWLKSISLEGNSFRQPRPQIMAKGTQFILEYLRDRIPT